MSSGTRRPAVLRLHEARLRGATARGAPVDHGSKRRRGRDLGRRPVEGSGLGQSWDLAAAAVMVGLLFRSVVLTAWRPWRPTLRVHKIRSACMSRFLAAKRRVELLPYGQGLQHVPEFAAARVDLRGFGR